MTLEPRDKLDATTMRDATKVADDGVAVNGPKAEVVGEWNYTIALDPPSQPP